MTGHRHSPECREIFARLSEYLDLELPSDICQTIEAHLKDCPPCIEFADSLKKTIQLCRQYSPNEMPSRLSDACRTELKQAYQKVLQFDKRKAP